MKRREDNERRDGCKRRKDDEEKRTIPNRIGGRTRRTKVRKDKSA